MKRACGTRRLVRASLHGATRRFMRAQRVLHIANGDASLILEVLDFQGLFVFLGVKNDPLSPLHLFPDPLDLSLRIYKSILTVKSFCDILKNTMRNDMYFHYKILLNDETENI